MSEQQQPSFPFRNRKKSVPVPHPDGGLFWLYPLDVERGDVLQKKINAIEENEELGQREKLRKIAEIVKADVVEKITGVADIDTGEPIEIDEEITLQILEDSSERLVEVEVPVLDEAGSAPKVENGKPVTEKQQVPANEPYFLWSIYEARKILHRKQAALGNS